MTWNGGWTARSRDSPAFQLRYSVYPQAKNFSQQLVLIPGDGMRISPLDKPLHHRRHIPGRVRSSRIRCQLIRRGIDRKTQKLIRPAALAFALLFLIFAIRYHAAVQKEEQLAAQAEASQAVAPLTSEQQQAAEQYARDNGEYIDYSDLYAKAESMDLPVGKRYRFRAFISDTGHSLFLHYSEYPQGPQKQLTAAATFDTEAEHESFLKSNDTDPRTIVASMGEDATILIY